MVPGSSLRSDRRRAVQPPAHERRHRAQTLCCVRWRLCVGRRELPPDPPPTRCADSSPRQETPCTNAILRSVATLCRAPGASSGSAAGALCRLQPTTGDTVHKRYFSPRHHHNFQSFPRMDHRRAVQPRQCTHDISPRLQRRPVLGFAGSDYQHDWRQYFSRQTTVE